MPHTSQFINLDAFYNLLVVVIRVGFRQMQSVELLSGKPIYDLLYLL